MGDHVLASELSSVWMSLVPERGDLKLDMSFESDWLRGCPITYRSIQSIAKDGGVSVDMALMGVLGAISLVCQRLIDVRRPGGLVGPVSQYILLVADSGARKTTVESVAYESVRCYQSSSRNEYKAALDMWSVEEGLWGDKYKKMRRYVAEFDIDSQEYLDGQEELKRLVKRRPQKPLGYKFLLEDATPESLFSVMCDGALNAGLVSSEGAGILNGRAFRDHAKLNSLWSGSDITVDRVKQGERVLSGGRLTISAMVQEDALFSYIEKKGEESRGVGLWARALICKPTSLRGQRLIDGAEVGRLACDEFSSRLMGLLNLGLPNNNSRLVVGFSAGAAEEWIRIYNFIEREMRPGGCYFDAADHASKLAEVIARVAALFAYFERGSVEISSLDLQTSAVVSFWCSRFFYEYFVGISTEEKNAEILELWLEENYKGVFSEAKKNDIRRSGPVSLRNTKALDRAIAVLKGRGRLESLIKNKTCYVKLVAVSGW